jgi:hypothetical protein
MLAALRSLDPLRVASICTSALILGAAVLLRLPRRRNPAPLLRRSGATADL